MSLLYHRSLRDGLTGKYAEVVARLEPKCSVLDVGCHTGYLVEALLDRGFEARGIDGDSEAVAVATRAGLPVRCVDLNGPELQTADLGNYDAILLLDILEHLHDPAALLASLQGHLNPNGKLLITGPNVAYWSVRKELLLGRWNYTDGGILDRTHVWFFTARTWRSLVESAGYRICRCVPGEGMIPLEHVLLRIPVLSKLVSGVRRLLLGCLPNLFAIVFLLEAVPQEFAVWTEKGV